MGFFDALLGRSKPVKANLDALFTVPGSALTLEARLNIKPTGVGAVGFRSIEGGSAQRAEAESRELISSDPNTTVTQLDDGHGFTWQVVHQANVSVSDLVTSLHAVNSSLEAQGFGPMLLCSTVYFVDPEGRRFALVYLYKRGTFYPFAHLPGQHQRDSAREIELNVVLTEDLNTESDLSKWSPLWDVPGLLD